MSDDCSGDTVGKLTSGLLTNLLFFFSYFFSSLTVFSCSDRFDRRQVFMSDDCSGNTVGKMVVGPESRNHDSFAPDPMRRALSNSSTRNP